MDTAQRWTLKVDPNDAYGPLIFPVKVCACMWCLTFKCLENQVKSLNDSECQWESNANEDLMPMVKS